MEKLPGMTFTGKGVYSEKAGAFVPLYTTAKGDWVPFIDTKEGWNFFCRLDLRNAKDKAAWKAAKAEYNARMAKRGVEQKGEQSSTAGHDE